MLLSFLFFPFFILCARCCVFAEWRDVVILVYSIHCTFARRGFFSSMMKQSRSARVAASPRRRDLFSTQPFRREFARNVVRVVVSNVVTSL